MKVRRRTEVVLLLGALALTPGALVAQGGDGPASACVGAALDAAFCRTVAQAAEALLPVLIVATEGGSPVPGTASTLGMRLTSAPRWSVGARTTLAWGSAPDVARRGGTSRLNAIPAAFAFDGSVGVLSGWNPLPTVGGVASLDLLLGVGMAPLIASDDWGGTGGWSWGAGARLGLLRESFTLPGVSLSAVYRQQRGIELGDPALTTSDSYVSGDLSVFSTRAAVSKAFLLLNVTAGVGYDLIYGDLELGYAAALGSERLTAEDVRMERVTVFGALSYTLLVLNFVLGAGWQEAPPRVAEPAPGSEYSPGGAFHASAALRLSI